MAHARLATIGLIALATVCGSCSSGAGTTGSSTTDASTNGPTVTVGDGGFPLSNRAHRGDVPEARLDGTFTVEGPCPYVVESAFGLRYLVFLPAGTTTWNAETQTMTVGDVGVRVGDLIGVGGSGRTDRPPDVDYIS